PLSIALALFGVVGVTAALVLTVLALGREVQAVEGDRRSLRVLGMGQRAQVATVIAGPLIAVLLGTAGALAVALATSPVMPLGPVRRVDPRRGVVPDATVLLAGVVVLVLATVVPAVVF